MVVCESDRNRTEDRRRSGNCHVNGSALGGSRARHACVGSGEHAKQLLAEALRLSDEERAALAGELIQSLDHDVDPDAEAAWSEEIRARLERVDGGTAETIPWSKARRRVHAAAGHGSLGVSVPSGVSCSEAHDDADGPHRDRP